MEAEGGFSEELPPLVPELEFPEDWSPLPLPDLEFPEGWSPLPLPDQKSVVTRRKFGESKVSLMRLRFGEIDLTRSVFGVELDLKEFKCCGGVWNYRTIQYHIT